MCIRGSRTTPTPWKALDPGTIDLATQKAGCYPSEMVYMFFHPGTKSMYLLFLNYSLKKEKKTSVCWNLRPAARDIHGRTGIYLTDHLVNGLT